MNILFVTPDYPPDSGGGGVVIQTIAKCLVKKGHKITVISGCSTEKKLIKRPQGEIIEEVKIIWIPLISILNKRLLKLKLSMPPNINALLFLRKINYDKYDIIHLSGCGHLLIDYINLITKNQSKILTIHAFQKYVEKNGEANFLLKLLYKIYFLTLGKHTINSAKAITIVSKFSLDEGIKKGISKEKMIIIENGIDLMKYKPLKYSILEEKFQIEKEEILILSISRIVWYKGFKYALQAVHKIKSMGWQVKYLILGSIEEKNYYVKLLKQVEKLGLINNVIFAGFVSEKLKIQALTRSNIFLAPSLHEGFGLVILEAMALGKPIIASNIEGFRCILDNMRTGILIKPANSEDIANAIILLLCNLDIQKRLSKNALFTIRKYNWKNVIETYEGLYNRVLNIVISDIKHRKI